VLGICRIVFLGAQMIKELVLAWSMLKRTREGEEDEVEDDATRKLLVLGKKKIETLSLTFRRCERAKECFLMLERL
jgi:hypothetical protein